MPPTYMLTLDARKVPLDQAYLYPEWFGDLDPELVVFLVGTIRREPYADITVTELIEPQQVQTLKVRHEYSLRPEDILEAAQGRWWHQKMGADAVDMGRIQQNLVVEQRMVIKVGDHLVGGTPDKLYYDPRRKCDVLVSRKTRTVRWWRWWKQGIATLEDEELQESLYAHLCRHGVYKETGKPVKRYPMHAILHFMIRDWSKRDARRARDKGEPYPPPFGAIPIELMPDPKAAAYLRVRLEAHMAARKALDAHLPECSDRDRWTNRKKQPLRCMDYCPVATFCHQWRREGPSGFDAPAPPPNGNGTLKKSRRSDNPSEPARGGARAGVPPGSSNKKTRGHVYEV